MEQPQPLCLLDERKPLLAREKFPSFTQRLRDLGIVDVWLNLDDLLSLDLAPHHEGIHRTFDVVVGVLLSLKNGKNIIG